jgi:hypothetical protein
MPKPRGVAASPNGATPAPVTAEAEDAPVEA